MIGSQNTVSSRHVFRDLPPSIECSKPLTLIRSDNVKCSILNLVTNARPADQEKLFIIYLTAAVRVKNLQPPNISCCFKNVDIFLIYFTAVEGKKSMTPKQPLSLQRRRDCNRKCLKMQFGLSSGGIIQNELNWGQRIRPQPILDTKLQYIWSWIPSCVRCCARIYIYLLLHLKSFAVLFLHSKNVGRVVYFRCRIQCHNEGFFQALIRSCLHVTVCPFSVLPYTAHQLVYTIK